MIPGSDDYRQTTTTGKTRAWSIASRLLRADKETACRVLGHSMSPFLSHNDIVWLRQVTAAQLKFGDIVLYRHDGGAIIHRFLARKRCGGQEILVIKGDAVTHNDPPVTADQVVARVVRVEKGRWRLALDTRSGRVLNIGIAILSSCPGLLGTARAVRRYLAPPRPRRLAR